MFSGIIESLGTVKKIIPDQANISFWIESELADQLKVDQSVAHNGVCLTVEEIKEKEHKVTAIEETLVKSTLSELREGDKVNLELCLRLNDRLDGHIVQGHVDATGTVFDIKEQEGSWLFTFQYPKDFAHLIVEKGSIAVNGVSLTAFNCVDDKFSVAIIPYTYAHTTFHSLKKGQTVNLEFDILGKYILRWAEVKKQ
jgi:riboflavin synthase